MSEQEILLVSTERLPIKTGFLAGFFLCQSSRVIPRYPAFSLLACAKNVPSVPAMVPSFWSRGIETAIGVPCICGHRRFGLTFDQRAARQRGKGSQVAKGTQARSGGKSWLRTPVAAVGRQVGGLFPTLKRRPLVQTREPKAMGRACTEVA